MSTNTLRKADPGLSNLTTEEFEELTASMYNMAELAFDVWWHNKNGSKNPTRSFPDNSNDGMVDV